MSPSLRFLGLTLGGWTAIRVGSAMLAPSLIATAAPTPAPLATVATAPTTVAPIGVVPEYAPPILAPRYSPPASPEFKRAATKARAFAPLLPARTLASTSPPTMSEFPPSAMSRRAGRPLGPTRPLDRWDVARFARPTTGQRLRLTSWALVRPGGGSSLASGGLLGGSQAGARLLYAVRPRIDLAARLSAPLGGKAGGEAALGIRVTPHPRLPIAVTLERRQTLGRNGGRDAFALLAEGGVYQKSLPLRFSLDGYAQAGIVGARRHDAFVDGALTATRPISRRLSLGAGIWGGAQPGVSRLDAGPRLTFRPAPSLRVDLDWRQQLAGDARPRSGPALTLAGDF